MNTEDICNRVDSELVAMQAWVYDRKRELDRARLLGKIGPSRLARRKRELDQAGEATAHAILAYWEPPCSR